MISLIPFMKQEGITLYSVLSYTDMQEIAPHLRTSLPFEVRSVILFLLPYFTGDTVNLSRYAASKDYHMEIQRVGKKLSDFLCKEYPDAHVKIYGDHSPIDERHAALIGGLGMLGDNGLLITEDYGSYVFIGEVLTDLPPDILGAVEAQSIRFCEHCGACRAACPTGRLRGEANDCLSAVTQRKGILTEQEIVLMHRHNTVWGCDICQSVCPHNRLAKLTPLPFFYEDRISELTSERLSEMTDEDFRARAFAWRGRKTIERNLRLLKK